MAIIKYKSQIMYSYKKELKPPLILIQCECGREFTQEEMYACHSCHTSICRYCTQNEIFAYYCRLCGEIQIGSEMTNLTAACQACLECPVCRNPLRRQTDPDKQIVFNCTFCFYSTRQIKAADLQINAVYQKINEAYKQEYADEHKEHLEQGQRIKSLDNSFQLQKKHVNKQHLLRSLTQSQKFDKPVYKMHTEEIEQMAKERKIKVDFDKRKLLINEQKQVLLEKWDPKPIKPTAPIPTQLGLLTRKNRKCRKCQKIIIQLNLEKKMDVSKQKEKKWIAASISSMHYESAPIVQLKKLKYANKEKTELIVTLVFFNRSKFQLEFVLQPFNPQIAEQYKLLPIKNLPSQPIVMHDSSDSDHQTQGATFDLQVQLKDQSKIQFAFVVDCAIKTESEKLTISYTANVYIG